MMYFNELKFKITEIGYAKSEAFPWIYPVSCGMEQYDRPLVLGKRDEQIIAYVVSGQGVAESSGISGEYYPGCVLVGVDAGKTSIYPQEKTCCMILTLKNAAALCEAAAERSFVLALSPDARVIRQLARICHRAQNRNMNQIELGSAEAYAIVMELCANASGQPVVFSKLVRDAIDIMHQDYAHISGIDEISEHLGVTKSHFIRTFSKEMDVPPGKYLQSVRLEQAKLLLAGRRYTSDLIAGMVGYADANYFAKVFRKAFGMSPGQYRRSLVLDTALDAKTYRQLEKIESRALLE